MTSKSDRIFYWRHKTDSDNDWHPRLPSAANGPLQRVDAEAAVADATGWVLLSGAASYVTQLPHLGVTQPFSPFTNQAVLRSLSATSTVAIGAILTAQAAGLQYRSYMPRWATEREKLQGDQESRSHILFGMQLGAVSLLVRNVFKIGPSFSRLSLLDIVIGGGVADICLREYYRAHGM